VSTTTARGGWRRRLTFLAVLSLLLSVPIGLTSVTPAFASVTVTTFAGTGSDGYNGDNQPATSAQLWGPSGLATDAAGNVYIADTVNDIIRKVDTSGTITTVRGTPKVRVFVTPTNSSDTTATGGLNRPTGVAVGQNGGLYVADTLNHVVWADSALIAGNVCGQGGFGGDNSGLSVSRGPNNGYCTWQWSSNPVELNQPGGVAVDDSNGAVYIADTNNCRIRKVGITTVAGNGTCGNSGDGGQATSASLNYPRTVAAWNGKLFIADTSNDRVRVVDLSTGVISTFTTVSTAPKGLAIDAAGNVYVGGSDGKVRVVNQSGTATLVATLPNNPYTGTPYPVQGLARDRQGNLYASGGSKVYKISGYPTQTLNYVALGDSVAAGEGINYQWSYALSANGPDWTSPNPVPVNWEGDTSSRLTQDCHRSIYAYPYIIAASKGYRLTDLACTGASTTNGLLNGQTEGSDGSEPAQIAQAFSDSSHEPNVITLTVGMDDLNFQGVLNQCYQPSLTDCQNVVQSDGNTLDQDLTTELSGYQSNLDNVLLSIKMAANAANVPLPHVYLSNYYDPFWSAYNGVGCRDITPISWANAGLSDTEIGWIKTQSGNMSSDIQSEVNAANLWGSGSWVTYVPLTDVMSSGNHQFCDAHPWVYGASILAPTWAGGNGDTGNPAPFHPNAPGQSAIATRFLSYIG